MYVSSGNPEKNLGIPPGILFGFLQVIFLIFLSGFLLGSLKESTRGSFWYFSWGSFRNSYHFYSRNFQKFARNFKNKIRRNLLIEVVNGLEYNNGKVIVLKYGFKTLTDEENPHYVYFNSSWLLIIESTCIRRFQ